MIGNVVLVNSGFYKQDNLSENYLQFGQASSKTVRQSCPRPKEVKEYRF